jgi:hypothetical protein
MWLETLGTGITMLLWSWASSRRRVSILSIVVQHTSSLFLLITHRCVACRLYLSGVMGQSLITDETLTIIY